MSTRRIPPSVILTGEVGTGKSTEALKGFPGCLLIRSEETVSRPFESLLEDRPEEAAERGWQRWAKEIDIPDYVVDTKPDSPTFGQLLKNPNWREVEKVIAAYTRRWALCKASGEPFPYNGIIFDEWSTFAARIYSEMRDSAEFCAKVKNKNTIPMDHPGRKFVTSKWKIDTFKIIDAIKKLHRKLCGLPRATKTILVLVCHSQPPKWEEDSTKKTYGDLKYPGGPSMPIGTLIEPVCATADVVLQVELEQEPGEDGVTRRYRTEAHPLWKRKFRDFNIDPTEPLGLRELLVKAKYID